MFSNLSLFASVLAKTALLKLEAREMEQLRLC